MADTSSTGRNFLLAGLALGLGAAAAGFYISSSFEKKEIDFNMSGEGGVAALSKQVKDAYDEAMRDTVLADVAPQNAWIARDKSPNASGKLVKNPEGKIPRYTPLFFAPQLWFVAEGPSKASVRDLLVMENPEKPDVASRVHKDTPNEWFFRYGLDSVLGRPDALALDTDGDGFSNQEEYAAGTDPSDAASHPPFLVGDSAKIQWVKRHTSTHTLELSSMSDFSSASPLFVVNSFKNDEDNRYQIKDLKPGDSFGLEAAAGEGSLAKDRFKIDSFKSGGADGNSIELIDTYAKSDSAKRITLAVGRSKKVKVRDVEVSLRMTAGSQKGKELSRPIQLGETFDVPGFEGVSATLVSTAKNDVRIKIGDKEVKIDHETSASEQKK